MPQAVFRDHTSLLSLGKAIPHLTEHTWLSGGLVGKTLSLAVDRASLMTGQACEFLVGRGLQGK